jgi:hypothetical protein
MSEEHHGKATKHVTEAITQPNEVIKHGKMEHADVAAKHAQEALTHLKQARWAQN